MINPLKSLWRGIKKIGQRVFGAKTQQRSYRDVLGSGGAFSDWAFSFLSEDGDIRNNIALLRDRSRDLFKTDCYFQKYTEELWANVFGENGIRLRMKVKETAPRVVYSPDEKAYREAVVEKKREMALRSHPGQDVSFHPFFRAKATIQIGDVDLYANTLIEAAWNRWQRQEFCTMARSMTYNQVRQIRLLSCARDGDFFLRMIRGKAAGNKFGFSLQLINSEWCDFNLNVDRMPNGNSIRMGVELNSWGEKVAFHFIQASPSQWQWATPGISSGMSTLGYLRVDASDVVHYVRQKYGDATRGAPWSAAVIPKSRQLDKFEEAEVIAARVAACKMGFLESNDDPDGGTMPAPNPCNKPPGWDQSPGGIQGLPWGVTFKEWNPNHPTQNFDAFRKGMLRSWCAGLPGADYNHIANDLEGINFSAGRLGKLDCNELWKLLQRFDIDTAETPIFEAWLEMALATGIIPLPLADYDKYNQPHFSGRRWAGVDPVKETQAAILAIGAKLMSYSQWFDQNDADLEETWTQCAWEKNFAEDIGIDLPAPDGASVQAQVAADEQGDEGNDKPDPTDAPKNGKSLHPSRT